MPLNTNDTLANGQYRILGLLGRGGFGFVYQAQDSLLLAEVAIKELIPALVGDADTLQRFLAEARATMRLAGKHIVRTHNVFQERSNYYIVMECMEGGSLEEHLRDHGPLPVGEAVRMAKEVCAGLDRAHQSGIVHCDLKPANILLSADDGSGLGMAKIADFGIAHISGEMLTRSWMTPAGFVAGTLPYMSPEQVDGERQDPRVDIYAMGAVLYRMLTGRTYLDFDPRETPGAQADNVLRIRNSQPVPPSTHNRRIPAWLDAVVLKALSKRPKDRYGSALEMQAALEWQGVALPFPPMDKVPDWNAPTGQRKIQLPTWFWPVVSVAGVLLMVIAIALLRRGATVGEGIWLPEPTRSAAAEPSPTLTHPVIAAPTPFEPAPEPTEAPIAQDLLEEVLEANRLLVSTDPNYAPQSFINDDGLLDGFDVDVAKEVARRLGVEIVFETPDWDMVTGGAWGGRWDVSIGSMTPTEWRAEVLWLSDPYYYIPASFAVHRENTTITRPADLTGRRLGLGTATTCEDYLDGVLTMMGGEIAYDPPRGVDVVAYSTDREAIQDLGLGDGMRLDAVMADLPTILGAIQEGVPLEVVGTPAFYLSLVFALDRSRGPSDRMLARLNEIVAEMHADGTLTELSLKWYGVDYTTIVRPEGP